MKTILTITVGECRYPMDRTDEHGLALFCSGASLPERSYCATHYAACHAPRELMRPIVIKKRDGNAPPRRVEETEAKSVDEQFAGPAKARFEWTRETT